MGVVCAWGRRCWTHPGSVSSTKPRPARRLSFARVPSTCLGVTGRSSARHAQSHRRPRCGGGEGLCFGGLPATQDGGGGSERGHVPPVEAAVVGIGRVASCFERDLA